MTTRVKITNEGPAAIRVSTIDTFTEEDGRCMCKVQKMVTLKPGESTEGIYAWHQRSFQVDEDLETDVSPRQGP